MYARNVKFLANFRVYFCASYTPRYEEVEEGKRENNYVV
jgi:hypothetical protein